MPGMNNLVLIHASVHSLHRTCSILKYRKYHRHARTADCPVIAVQHKQNADSDIKHTLYPKILYPGSYDFITAAYKYLHKRFCKNTPPY